MTPDVTLQGLRSRHEQLLAERDDYYSGTAQRGEIAGWIARRLERAVFDGTTFEEPDICHEHVLLRTWIDLVEVYREFDEWSNDDVEYQTRIVSLLDAFEYPIPTRVVALVVGCSKGHARRFYWDDEKKRVREKRWSRRQRDTQAPPQLVKYVRDRDRNQCVRCRSEHNLVVHHVTPVTSGGEAEEANLITLCNECHSDAHKGALNTGDVVYDCPQDLSRWLAGIITKDCR
ncbi:HNH endonuclease [Salinigranum sp. GCM10025319]|uniref:HNH endonuclease n=1 Tax=Salinigranum sp. GCM10025319 TaxID=3252687 RepID=UPI00361A982F